MKDLNALSEHFSKLSTTSNLTFGDYNLAYDRKLIASIGVLKEQLETGVSLINTPDLSKLFKEYAKLPENTYKTDLERKQGFLAVLLSHVKPYDAYESGSNIYEKISKHQNIEESVKCIATEIQPLSKKDLETLQEKGHTSLVLDLLEQQKTTVFKGNDEVLLLIKIYNVVSIDANQIPLSRRIEKHLLKSLSEGKHNLSIETLLEVKKTNIDWQIVLVHVDSHHFGFYEKIISGTMDYSKYTATQLGKIWGYPDLRSDLIEDFNKKIAQASEEVSDEVSMFFARKYHTSVTSDKQDDKRGSEIKIGVLLMRIFDQKKKDPAWVRERLEPIFLGDKPEYKLFLIDLLTKKGNDPYFNTFIKALKVTPDKIGLLKREIEMSSSATAHPTVSFSTNRASSSAASSSSNNGPTTAASSSSNNGPTTAASSSSNNGPTTEEPDLAKQVSNFFRSFFN